jgi:transcriptional regulator with XRE-family HTH domain
MPEMPSGLCRALRQARLDRRVTQSLLAEWVGCQQSAISMLERGDTAAVSRETVQAIAERLEVDLSAFPLTWGVEREERLPRYCPSYDCPSNLPYVVRGELYVLPHIERVSGDGAHCRYCGELLETHCPKAECGSPFEPGNCCCGICGLRYVAVPDSPAESPLVEWADNQRRRIGELGLRPGRALGARAADAGEHFRPTSSS